MNTLPGEMARIIAHEMRCPLGAIRYALEIMPTANTDARVLDDLRHVIARQLQQLSRLVDDLLAAPLPTPGSFELHKTPIDLLSTVRRAMETTQPLIERFCHRLTTNFPSGAALIDGDADRLTQVFINLLENAAYYTEPGGRIVMSVERDPRHIAVRIQDNGAGIPAELVARIFDIHVRGDDQVRSRPDGAGVGLTVARRIVDAHSGTISASSDGPGLGSTFTVRLPAHEAEGMPRARDTRWPPQKVLLLVDDSAVRDSTRLLLKAEGYDVTSVSSLAEVLRQIGETNKPDLLVAEAGADVLAALRKTLGVDPKAVLIADDPDILQLEIDPRVRTADRLRPRELLRCLKDLAAA